MFAVALHSIYLVTYDISIRSIEAMIKLDTLRQSTGRKEYVKKSKKPVISVIVP